METKLVKVETTELDKVVKSSGLAIIESEEIKAAYIPFLARLIAIQEQAVKINFDNPTLLDEEIASRLRKDTVKIRTDAEKLKDEQKKVDLLRGKVKQDSYNLVASSCKLAEEVFFQVEKARQIAENKRKEALKAERIEKLIPYDIGAEFYDLANMPDEVFENLLIGAKTALENKIAAEKKAEEDRLAKIESDRVENERIRKENERLQAEAKERERLAEIERKKQADILKAQQEKADKERKELEENNRKERELAEANAAKLKAENEAKLEVERKERERLAAELKVKKDEEEKVKQAEIDRLAAEEKERIKASKATDREKLNKWVDSFTLTQLGAENIKPESIKIANDITEKFYSFKVWAKLQVEGI
jgi:hypothetical protein